MAFPEPTRPHETNTHSTLATAPGNGSSPNGNGESYHVALDVFSGPLDLLLYLIKKEEVEIHDIPIARITRQYLQYIDMMQKLDLELAGEFVLMAATLIRIKTRLLLPRDEEEGDEIDPREELIMALVEYRKYREIAEMLRERALLEESFYPITAGVEKIAGRVDLMPASTVFDLALAHRDVLRQRPEERLHEVDIEEVSIIDRAAFVMQVLSTTDSARFEEMYADAPRTIVAVVAFIALLELARARRVSLRQALPFDELRVFRGQRFTEPLDEIDVIAAVPVGETEPTTENETVTPDV